MLCVAPSGQNSGDCSLARGRQHAPMPLAMFFIGGSLLRWLSSPGVKQGSDCFDTQVPSSEWRASAFRSCEVVMSPQ